ncbi:uncharacterized protein STEHIDRAFT_162791 [Stereum hirsutum FP-91666 SS1]|uniref:Protein kinase domain-containing protein n=1 Tax=Stereum hirsutum (strain FP-91666) TaxID=721885 RepID=R7RYG9_STEHR|nr:uncharacterized protein STEHIDRAFT_162791 [Stereum hirsutum FP-91666 SS1]EIM80374.1 hypothetical protein STEHIDRAFT_162791 [Stereum hirsutum FP-91666 SS1]
MSCLVLEYCGESVVESFGDLSLDIRGQIINAFFSIHRAGVEHNDAAERNIVWDGKHVYIVDFADASEDHACAAKPPILNTVAVHAAEFGCSELWDLLTELRLWHPSEVWYAGQALPMQIIYTPAEFLRYKPSYWTKEEAIKQAWDVIKEYTKVYMPAAYQRIIDDELKTEQEKQKRNAESAVARQQDGRTSSRKATNSGVDTSVLRKSGLSGGCAPSGTCHASSSKRSAAEEDGDAASTRAANRRKTASVDTSPPESPVTAKKRPGSRGGGYKKTSPNYVRAVPAVSVITAGGPSSGTRSRKKGTSPSR